MKNEEWKPVVGYDGLYEVSNLGNVKSLNYRHTGETKMLTKRTDKDGYKLVKLYRNGKYKLHRVHRIVYESFKGAIPEGMEIDHRNTVKDDNRVENLRCVTSKENSNNPITKKRHDEACKELSSQQEWKNNVSEAVKKANSKPINQYTLDGEFVKQWPSMHEIERELGIANCAISFCCNGKRKTAGGCKWAFA